jgi:hypothetical protein
MSDGIKIESTGIPELDELFSKLKDSQKVSAWRSALRKSAKPILNDARSNLTSRTQHRSGKLYDSLGIFNVNREAGVAIGARTKGKYKGYIGAIIDQGSKAIRYTKGGGKLRRGRKRRAPYHPANRGRLKATNFFTDAVEQNETQVINSVEENFTTSVVKLVERYNKKAARKK